MSRKNGAEIYNAHGEASGGCVEDLRGVDLEQPKRIRAPSLEMYFKLAFSVSINPKRTNLSVRIEKESLGGQDP